MTSPSTLEVGPELFALNSKVGSKRDLISQFLYYLFTSNKKCAQLTQVGLPLLILLSSDWGWSWNYQYSKTKKWCGEKPGGELTSNVLYLLLYVVVT